MIVCSCNLITSKDIAEAVVTLRSNDPFVVITPALIYRHLGKRPSCGNCLPLIDWSASTTAAMAPSAMSDSKMGQVTAGF
jgi:bacterioferritin-associated ferredoxin